MSRQLIQNLILTLIIFISFSSSTFAQTVPLSNDARETFLRAEKNAKSVYMESGTIGLNTAIYKCYQVVDKNKSLKSLQYCYALNLSSVMIDSEAGGRTPGLSQQEWLARAEKALVELGYSKDQRSIILVGWLSFMIIP